MPKLRVRDTELYYDDTAGPDGRETIVFSHGLLMNGDMFADQAAALADRYRSVRYDHRGQGRSAESDLRSIDMGEVTADAIALIEALRIAPVHFVGLSMGGFVGLRIAARRPELLRSLVLLETSADAEPAKNLPRYRALTLASRLFGSRGLAGQILPILFGRTFLSDPRRAGRRAEWEAWLRGQRRSIWRAVNGVLERETVAPELARITLPTLIVVGDEDVATGPDRSERIHRGIAGSRLVRIPRAGHSSTIEEPEAVTAAIRAFLSALA